MDALVLETQEERPQGWSMPMGGMAVGEVGVVAMRLADDGMDLLPVVWASAKLGHSIRSSTSSQRISSTPVSKMLEVGLSGRRMQAGDPQLVDVEGRRMTVVEDHGVGRW